MMGLGQENILTIYINIFRVYILNDVSQNLLKT